MSFKPLIKENLNKLINEVDWKDKFSDVSKSCISPEVMVVDLNNELKRLDIPSPERPKRSLDKTIVTRGNIPLDKEGDIDIEKFKKLITIRPDTIFDQNPKMEKTDVGKEQLTVNTGIPALNGIIYDEEHGKFYKINTCPGAGSCKVICYARKGFYGMSDGKTIKLIRRLNLLMNNPTEYYNMIMDELEPLAFKLKRQGRRDGKDIKLVIRWNDAGDFFSDTYFKMAQDVTKELIGNGYNVMSYAYTKQGKLMNLANNDFVMNFSTDANKKGLANVNLNKVKKSIIVPKELFNDLFVTDKSHFARDEKNRPIFKNQKALNTLKDRISKKYDVPEETLLLLDELPTKEGESLQFNAIVLPSGDGDISAQRKDVKTTFLMFH